MSRIIKLMSRIIKLMLRIIKLMSRIIKLIPRVIKLMPRKIKLIPRIIKLMPRIIKLMPRIKLKEKNTKMIVTKPNSISVILKFLHGMLIIKILQTILTGQLLRLKNGLLLNARKLNKNRLKLMYIMEREMIKAQDFLLLKKRFQILFPRIIDSDQI